MSNTINPIVWLVRSAYHVANAGVQAVIGAGGGLIGGCREYDALSVENGVVSFAKNPSLLATEESLKGAFEKLAQSLGKKVGDLKWFETLGTTIRAYLHDWFYKLFGAGIKKMSLGNLGEAFSKVFSNTKGGLAALGEAVGGLGPAGWAVGALCIVISLFAITKAKLALSEWKKVSDIKKGWPGDPVTNPWVHGIQAAFAAGTAAGGIMMLNPFTFLIGLPTAIASYAGVLALHAVRKISKGYNVLNCPKRWIWPFYLPFQWDRNGYDYYHSK